MTITYDLAATVALPSPGGPQEISFETNSIDAGIILWALASATLGAYISFTLLAQSKPEERIVVPLKRWATLIILAALSLAFGCCACQLLTSRASLEPLQSTHVAPFIAFRLSFVALSVCIPAIIVASAFFILSFRSKCDSDDKLLVWKCLACGLLVGLSVGFMHYSPFLSLPYFSVTFDPAQTFLVFLLNVSGSLFSFLATVFYVNKVQMAKTTTILLHLLISLIFGACIIGAGMLAHLGMRFELKGKGTTEETNEFDRKQRDVLTLAIPAVISVVLTCAAVRLIFASKRLSYLKHRNALKCPPSPHLTLASIAFSQDGRILVNKKGMLPTESVDLRGLPENILNELGSHTPTFHWLLAISFDWSIISSSMQYINIISVLHDKQTLSSLSCSALWQAAVSSVSTLTTSLLAFFCFRAKSRSPSSSSDAVPRPVPATQAKARLKLRLLAAASQLATRLDIPLEELGSLHERALGTGSRIAIEEFLRISEHASAASRPQQLQNQSSDSVDTAIKANAETGKGLMLFFVRSLPHHAQHHKSENQYSPSESAQPSSGIQEPRPRSLDSSKSEQVESSSSSNSARRLQQQQQHCYPPSRFKMRFMGRCRDMLADTTGAKPADVDKIFNGCKNKALKRSYSVLEAGCTYVSLLVDKVSCDGSSEVLVYEFAKHQLPSYKVNLLAFTQEMRTWLRDMSGFTALDIIQICKHEVEQGRLGLLPRRSRSRPRHTRQKYPLDVSASLDEDEREDENRKAILLHFKHALRTAVAQLMRDLSFVGEGLEIWTYLTPHVLDVPSSCDADSSDGSASASSSSAHMIVLHAELPDPLDVDSLEDEIESGFTHHSSAFTSSLSRSAAEDPRGTMPSVFEYIPRTLFDVLHMYFISPECTREAFRKQATKELDVLIGHDEEETTLTGAASQPGQGRGPGRLPRALVSSFSIDSVDGDDDERRRGRSRGRNLTAATANLQKSWETVKSHARAISLLPARRKRTTRRKNDRTPIPIPLSQSASRTRLLLHSNSGSSSTTAATSTCTANCYYDKDCRVAASKVRPESDNSNSNSNSRHQSAKSKPKPRSLSRSEARRPRWEGFEDGDGNTAMPISIPLPVPPTPFRLHHEPGLESHRSYNNKVSNGNRAAWKSVPDVAVSTAKTTRGGFF